jgi:uncharacterized membrane protein (UPF0127 family)
VPIKTKNLFLASGALLLIGIFLLHSTQGNCPRTLEVNGVSLNIECALSSAERERGLSGRQNLPENSGMLFVFENPGQYAFWMKDMNFPLDIIWLSAEKKVIYVKENAAPDSYPASFGPKEKAKYVLEVNALESARLGIKEGDIAKF